MKGASRRTVDFADTLAALLAADEESQRAVRQAAYRLPQVVKPGDYIAERSAGFEEHLDKLGLVLLQKPGPPTSRSPFAP